jgi:hypothetical protein
MTKKILFNLCVAFLFLQNCKLFAQAKQPAQILITNNNSKRLFGLTIDESSFDDKKLNIDGAKQIENIIIEIKKIKDAQPNNNTLTVRIVMPIGCENGDNCDPTETKETNKLDKKYIDLIKRIKKEGLANVMAEVVDSDVESSSKCFKGLDKAAAVANYLERTKKLYNKLGQFVDIWEIGNECNGDWVGGNFVGVANNNQRRKIVVAEMKATYDFLTSKKIEVENSNKQTGRSEKIPQTAITFYFSGVDKKRHSYENINDEMMGWIKGEGSHFIDDNNNKIKFTNLDYLLISYYPEDNFYEDVSGKNVSIVLTAKEWVEIFATVKANYSPNTKFGLGEIGAQCYYSKNIDNCTQCKTLVLDYEKNEKNPCDNYDTKGEVIEGRKCSCCYCAQIKVVKDYYTDLDKQISDEMKTDTRFQSAERFIGGYFNWYYSPDVINKMATGNTEDKLQAEKIRNATIEAYKAFLK